MDTANIPQGTADAQAKRWDAVLREQQVPSMRDTSIVHSASLFGKENEQEKYQVVHTLVRSTATLTKTLSVAGGKLVKSRETALSEGVAVRKQIEGTPTEILSKFAATLKGMKSTEAIITAPPPVGSNEWKIVSKDKLAGHRDAISRTKENFPALDVPSIIGLDFDTGDFTGELLDRIRQEGDISRALASVHAPFEKAATLLRASVSAGGSLDGKVKETGHHRYFVVSSAAIAAEKLKILADRLMLAGFIWPRITQNGNIIPRTLFDVQASGSPERLLYEADPILQAGVHRHSRDPVVTAGTLLDLASIEPLSQSEQKRLEAVHAELETTYAAEAKAARDEWDALQNAKQVKKLMRKGRSAADAAMIAERNVNAVHQHKELSGVYEIQLDGGEVVTVSEILERPADYHGRTCGDPVEPEYGSGKAIIFSHQDTPIIHSFAHGSRTYHLKQDWSEIDGFASHDALPTNVTAVETRGEASEAGLVIVRSRIQPKDIPVRQWVVEPRMPLGDVAQCVGEPGVSKSTLMLMDALAVASGKERILRGGGPSDPISYERLHRSGPALVYNSEERTEELLRRLSSLQKHHGVEDQDMKHPIVLWSGVDGCLGTLKLAVREGGSRGGIKEGPGVAILRRVIREQGIIAVSLDTQIGLVSGGVENSNDDTDALLQICANLAAETGCSITVVHHTSKQTRDAAGDMNAGRGAFSAIGKVRVGYTLTKAMGFRDDEKNWGVSESDFLIRLDFAKVSHSQKPTKPIVFRRIGVSVGNGTGLVQPHASGALFTENPKAALEASGDFAPVLEIVRVENLIADRKAAGIDNAKAESIARIADSLMADSDEIKLADILEPIGVKLRESGLSAVTAPSKLRGEILAALGATGVELSSELTIRARQKQRGRTAPWLVQRVKPAAPGVFK